MTASRVPRAAVGKVQVAMGVLAVFLIAVAVAYTSTATQSFTLPTFASTESPTFTSSTIKIGFVTEITNGVGTAVGVGEAITPNQNGYAARIGAELAVNATNAAGGVDGKTIDLVVLDSETNPQRAIQLAESLDQKDGVLAITGPTDQEDAVAISEYAEKYGVPFVVSSVSSGLLTPPGSYWTVDVEPDAVQWGAAVAKYVSEAIPNAKIALMTQNADQQREMSAGVQWYAKTFKNESVVFDQIYANAQFPWATAAEAAKASGANAVVISWLPTPGFSQSNVVEAVRSAGFLPSQVFVASADDQVSDLGLNATGVRGVTLFDSALTGGYPNASAFVSRIEPFVNGELGSEDYCGVCPVEVGPNYYYAYLGMEMMINAIRGVLSSGQALSRADFISAMKHESIQDAFGNTLSVGPGDSAVGTFYVVAVGNVSSNETIYDLGLVTSIRFAPGSVPSWQVSRTA